MKFGTVGWLTLGVLILAGCNSSAPKTDDSGKSGADSGAKTLKVGIVFDSGGRGDKSFNDSAYDGVSKAKTDLGIDEHEVESKAEKDYETNLSAMASQGMDLVFAVGLAQSTALGKVAPKYPNVKFAIIDSVVDAPNVRSITFSEEQGSFLAGYLAGLTTKSGKIGFVGGKAIPLIKKFEVGYIAGAKTSNPKVELLPSKYTESWDDINNGKASAKVLFDQGADIVYHAAGRCGLGVIAAAKESGKYAIGVDSDQDDVAPGNVLTSMMKRVDNAVYATIKDLKDGKFTAGTVVYDLKSGGVGLSPMKNTKDKVAPDALQKVEAISKKIVDGSIKVPSTEDELKTFKAS